MQWQAANGLPSQDVFNKKEIPLLLNKEVMDRRTNLRMGDKRLLE